MTYKTVTYRIKGIVTEQSALDDLQKVLNDYGQEGNRVISVQLIGEADFLIILEKE